jgi:hypothetical protein
MLLALDRTLSAINLQWSAHCMNWQTSISSECHIDKITDIAWLKKQIIIKENI